QSVAPFNSYYQGSSAGSYTVNGGETLSSIAQSLWGDASLWWKLAQANGLSGSSALAEGQTLVIPTGVNSVAHNTSTFSPLDPSDIIGNVSPTAATPQPQPKHNTKCGFLGQIIVQVVAFVVARVLDHFIPGLGNPVANLIRSAFIAGAGDAAGQGAAIAMNI